MLDNRTQHIEGLYAGSSDFKRSVIAFCKTSAANTGVNSFSSGRLGLHRYNGLNGLVYADISIECAYSKAQGINFTIISNKYNSNKTTDFLASSQGIRPCIFTYEGIVYGGVEVYFGNAALESGWFDGTTNFDIFCLNYCGYSANGINSPDIIINEEIYNSINFDVPVSTRSNLFINGKTILDSENYSSYASTYSAGEGISLSGTTFSNSGVRSVTTGTTNGTITVDTNGTAINVAVKGLQDGAYYPYNNFYNEYYGRKWYQLSMINSGADRGSIFYKIADLGRTSGYGIYEAIKIIGYMYHHKGNWGQSQTVIIPFQAIVDVSNDIATLYSTRQCSTNWLRLVKVDTRLYELQASCDMAHCDFDIFYQVSNSGSNNCTIYEGQNLVAGTTTGTVLSITNSENWGNYAYKTDQLTTPRTISLTGDVTGSASFDGSANISIAAVVGDNSHNHTVMPSHYMGNTSGVYVYTEGNNTHMCWRTGTSSAYKYFSMNSDGNFYINGCVALHSSNYTTYCAPASHTHSYVPLSGGTMTGTLNFANNVGISGLMAGGSDGWSLCGTGVDDAGVLALTITDNASTDYFDIIFDDWNEDPVRAIRFGGTRIDSYVPLYGAVWNDYAEYRSGEITEPGRVIHECPDGIMRMSTKRLEPACEIISDTFGFAIGETDKCKTPIAATGRVLAYVDSNRYDFNLGDAVCSGANGTVSKMTREEIMMYPERIIGTVSEIPEYETWGTGNVKVNGRIWIRIK